MTTSEPTTGENRDTECAIRALNTIAMVSPQWNDAIKVAADRLESQERDNSDLRETLKITCENWSASSNEKNEQIAALTDRAEQAERERDAAIKFIRTSDWCAGCENMKNLHCDFMKECANPHDLYKLRGLPQEGEGK